MTGLNVCNFYCSLSKMFNIVGLKLPSVLIRCTKFDAKWLSKTLFFSFWQFSQWRKLFSVERFQSLDGWISQQSLVLTWPAMCQITPLKFLKFQIEILWSSVHMKCFSREDLIHIYQKQLNVQTVTWLLHDSPHQFRTKIDSASKISSKGLENTDYDLFGVSYRLCWVNFSNSVITYVTKLCFNLWQVCMCSFKSLQFTILRKIEEMCTEREKGA